MTNHPNRAKWRSLLTDRAEALGPDLVTAWIALQREECTTINACAARLSESAGVTVTYGANLLLAWRRGAVPVPQPVQRVMRRDLLRYLLASDDGAETLSRLLEPPARATASQSGQ